MIKDRSKLATERRNPRSSDIDRASSLEIVDIINADDALLAGAVRAQRRQIAAVVEMIATAFRTGGRLFYVGAGTSGRLGVLDASECPPTYGVERTLVQGIIAGGKRALTRSVEGAEDSAADGAAQIDRRKVGPKDVVVGIAACGVTPFVNGAIRRATQRGAATAFVTCAPESRKFIAADVVITAAVGPEIVTGSTRMKAGTATKLILNTLTTAAMIRTGKVYGNLMVDLRASNRKLRDRARRIVCMVAGASPAAADALLKRSGGSAKLAIVMHCRKVDAAAAKRLLKQAGGLLRAAIEVSH